MPRHPTHQREDILAGTRQRLLNAAAIEFARRGFSAASVDAISSAAGLAKGTVYNYFPSKRVLMEELLRAIGEEHFAYVTQRVLPAGSPSERLRAFFVAGFAFVEDCRDQARVSLSMINGADAGFNAALYTAYLPFFHFLAEQVLGPGIAAGEFRACQPLETASILMTLYLGSAASIDPHGKPWMDPQVVADFALASLRPG